LNSAALNLEAGEQILSSVSKDLCASGGLR